MKLISLALFLVCIIIITLFESNKVAAQITTARKWACSNGAGKSIAKPTDAVWDPDADRLITTTDGFNTFMYLMSWDVSKPPDTGCVAIAFDGTNTATTASATGLTAKTRKTTRKE